LILNLKTLFTVNLLYIIVLFVLAIKNFDLGTDEACYVVYAKAFCSYGFPFGTINGDLFQIDYYSYLPHYLFTFLFSLFNADSVWHFKFLSTLLSLVSIASIFFIIKKIYGFNTSVLFLLFFTVQPGFGYISSSFFGEVTQTALIFLAAYFWLIKNEKVTNKTVLLTGFIFALAIHTKIQSLIPVVVCLILYIFMDRSKKSALVLLSSLAFTFLIASIRLIPVMLYEPSFVSGIPRFWFLFLQSQSKNNIIELSARIVLFNKFLPIFLFSIITAVFAFRLKSAFEKFLYSYALIVILWWIFSYHLSNYRLIFMGLIPLMFLMALLVTGWFKEFSDRSDITKPGTAYLTSFCILLLCWWGFSTNLVYACIGYNDGVQFDLDGSKSVNFSQLVYDNSQKKFYDNVLISVEPSDSIYVLSGGTQIFVPQYYLGSRRVFDFGALKSRVVSGAIPKFVIIDRTGYPLGLDEGYKMIDSLNVHRKLVLKEGEFELYSIFKE